MRILRILIFATLFVVSSAQALMLTGAFTGAWFDEDAPGQGFLIQVVAVEGVDTVVVYWFTFDADGNQIWLVGQGPVDGDSVTMTMISVTGGVLVNGGFDASGIVIDEWGQLVLGFDDCDSGTVSFMSNDPSIGDGEFEISRLTQSLGDDCSGGVSDNNPPGMAAVNLRDDFVSTGADEDASGRVKFEQNSNHTKFKVWVKKLESGSYDLVVGGEIVGTIQTNNGGNGKLFFRSPESCNWELLDFDPRNQLIEVVQDGVVFLTLELADEDDGGTGEDGDGDDDDGDDDDSECADDDDD